MPSHYTSLHSVSLYRNPFHVSQQACNVLLRVVSLHIFSSPLSIPSLSSLLSSPLPLYSTLFYSILFYSPFLSSLLSSSIRQVQLQAWNAIDTATPIEMAGKTALNLLWFTVLARTLSTIFKQYVQASREFLVQLKEKQLSGNNRQFFFV